MREHVPQQTRIHYVITAGGAAPNVVPASASVYYYVRHPEPGVVRDVFARLRAAAEGAAQGTGTSVVRSEEHTSELQSLMRISYAVFCLKKKKKQKIENYKQDNHNHHIIHIRQDQIKHNE